MTRTTKDEPANETLSITDAAEEADVSRETIRRAIQDGRLAATRPGGKPKSPYRIKRSDFERFLIDEGYEPEPRMLAADDILLAWEKRDYESILGLAGQNVAAWMRKQNLVDPELAAFELRRLSSDSALEFFEAYEKRDAECLADLVLNDTAVAGGMAMASWLGDRAKDIMELVEPVWDKWQAEGSLEESDGE